MNKNTLLSAHHEFKEIYLLFFNILRNLNIFPIRDFNLQNISKTLLDLFYHRYNAHNLLNNNANVIIYLLPFILEI